MAQAKTLIVSCILFAFSINTYAEKVVIIPLFDSPSGVNCPAAKGNAAEGPVLLHNFCWYLSAAGASCDSTCSDLGKDNLAYEAENEWPDACSTGALAEDVSQWFRDHGNPGDWGGAATTTYHTLGYGYGSSVYAGKCSTGSSTNAGSYPGETNNSGTRQLVCACGDASP